MNAYYIIRYDKKEIIRYDKKKYEEREYIP